MSATSPARVLCVIHHEPGDLGLIPEILRARGAEVVVRQTTAGDALPAVGDVSHAVIFGGAMSANSDDPAIAAERTWVDAALKADVPLFGICLGAQMIARGLGQPVAPRGDGVWEIGYRALRPTVDGARLFEDAPPFFQWHEEGFGLPEGAVRLASNDVFPNQAFRYGERVVGLQFHPEVGAEQLQSWHARFGDLMARPGADSIAQQVEDDRVHRPRVEAWLSGFVADWMDGRLSEPS